MRTKADLAGLAALLAPNQLLTRPIELLTYEADASLDRGTPDAVVLPRSTEEVVSVVQWAGVSGAPVIARGAGTGLSGGAVAEHGGLILAFSRMNKILEFDEAGRSVVVQPGVVNLVLDEHVKTKGLYFPPDPASGRTATIGGNIAENAGGPHCFKYGVTTNYVTGLEVVLADGTVVRLGGRAMDIPEYDFVGLMTGNEGTLGIITEASARLLRNAPAIMTALAAFDSVEAAGRAVSAVIKRGLVPATMEMMDRKIMGILEDYAHAGLPVHAGAALIIEADGYEGSVGPQMDEIAAILRQHDAREIRIAQTAEERDRIWYGRKSAAGAMARLAPAYYLVDGTVPRSVLAATLAEINAVVEAAELRVGYVFHAGDGNLHPFILIPDPSDPALMARVLQVGHDIMRICVGKGGSITGEHGVGSEKRHYMPLMYSFDELDVMRHIKEVFDPALLLNPGKIFPKEWPEPRAQQPPSVPPSPTCAPQTAQEAGEAVQASVAAGKRIAIVGGLTKSGDGGEVDVVLSTARLRGIRSCSVDDLVVTAGAGTRLADLQAELAREGMWTPLVSPWAAATIGGMVAANFNAPLRMRYGNVRDIMLAGMVVLPDGRTIRAGRPVVKNVAGYDLPKLFVGSYGTLGLLTDVSLKLAPLPRARASLIVPVDSVSQGMRWGRDLLRVCLVASALVLCSGRCVPRVSAPYALIYTAEGMPEDVAAEMAQVEAVLRASGAHPSRPGDAPSGSELWAEWLGAAGPEPIVRAGAAPKDLERLVAAVARANEGPSSAADRPSFAADLASGQLFARGVAVETTRSAALPLGGYAVVVRGEAGESDPWGYRPQSLDLMAALKRRLDPAGLFNPGAFLV